ncbi:hypothetical protein RI103_19615 [Paraburkholderia sp. FT54]|nr:hypothetical protein [Paraburkholderia sp. FT54]WNC93051.1 hypothetical protein RI103_19615 [Paraburkholderia sp. FT54]
MGNPRKRRFRRVPQRPDQLGKPGCASPGDKDSRACRVHPMQPS